MRQHSHLVTALVFIAALGVDLGLANAQKPKKTAAPAAPSAEPAAQAPEPSPAPGQCVYTQPTLKRCATLGAKGVFEIQTVAIGATYIQFVDGIVDVTKPPESQYKAEYAKEKGARVGANVLYVKAKPGAPDSVPVVVVTETLRVTLVFRSPKPNVAGDSQVEIGDPEHDAHLVDRDAQLAEREKKVVEREQQLETRAAARADTQLLEDIAHAGVELRSPGTTTERNGKQVLLRAQQIVRVGSRRFLLFTVENRSDATFIDVQDVRLWLQEGGAETALTASWRLDKKHIATDDGEVRGVIAIPLPRAPGSKTRLRLRVECAQADHTIELKGIGGL